MSGAEVMHLLRDEFGVSTEDEIERRGLLAVYHGEVAIGTDEPSMELGRASSAPKEGVCHVFKRLKFGLNSGACGGLIKVLLGHPAETGDVWTRDSEQISDKIGIEPAGAGISEAGSDIGKRSLWVFV
jgi:hypothetical protein